MIKFFTYILLVIFSFLLQACGGSNDAQLPKSEVKPDTQPLLVTYNTGAALRDFYATTQKWELKGVACCAGGDLSASLQTTPIADGGSFILDGHSLNFMDLNLSVNAKSASGTENVSMTESSHIGYEASSGMPFLATVTRNGKLQSTVEIFQPLAIPAMAKVGDSGSLGKSTLYENYPVNPVLMITVSHSWELKSLDARVLLCLISSSKQSSVDVTINTRRCHEVSEKGQLGKYLSLEQTTLLNNGTTQSSGYTLKTQ